MSKEKYSIAKEGAFREEREETLKELRKRVDKVAEELHDPKYNYKFEIREEGNYFVIVLPDRETKIMKWETIPKVSEKGEPISPSPRLEKVIEETIVEYYASRKKPGEKSE
ncbi:MAG: hypothetical protein Q7S28_00625 [bacterium]|nr:hypothetical protein [bacterium]